MALTRNRLLLSKIEEEYGVSSSPEGTDALKVSELEVSPLEVELIDRELITPYFGNTQKVVSQRMCNVNFSCELAGSGVVGVAPKWGPVLRACGFVENIVEEESVIYTPVSSGFESVTMDFRADGTRHLITGVRGNVTISIETGAIPRLNFEMMGLYNDPTGVAIPSVTFDDQADPVVINSENTLQVSIHDYAACLQSMELNVSNEVVYRQLAGCSRQVRLTDRKPEGTISIESPDLEDKDYFYAVSNQSLAPVSFTHGTTAGNIIQVVAPNCNLGSPAYGDSDGVMLLELPFMPNPIDGNDELEIILT